MKYILLTFLIVLAGCSRNPGAAPVRDLKTTHLPVNISIGVQAPPQSLRITEVCYDGYTYLVTQTGGITSKVQSPGC